jgi:hypothetical protein
MSAVALHKIMTRILAAIAGTKHLIILCNIRILYCNVEKILNFVPYNYRNNLVLSFG